MIFKYKTFHFALLFLSTNRMKYGLLRGLFPSIKVFAYWANEENLFVPMKRKLFGFTKVVLKSPTVSLVQFYLIIQWVLDLVKPNTTPDKKRTKNEFLFCVLHCFSQNDYNEHILTFRTQYYNAHWTNSLDKFFRGRGQHYNRQRVCDTYIWSSVLCQMPKWGTQD